MNNLELRSIGNGLLVIAILFIAAAFATAYFRRMAIPSAPFDQLTIIANDRIGWTVQAITFPTLFLLTAIAFALIARRLPGGPAQQIAWAAAALFLVGTLAWLPITLQRLQIGAQAADLLRTFDAANPPVVNIGGRGPFWIHTISVWAALILLSVALALVDVRPTLFWSLAGLTGVAALLGLLVMRDWPPFMTYILVLILAFGLR